MSESGPEILIVAGEPSGDRHAADLVQALKQRHPALRFTGIGGDRMAAEGVELLYHIRQMAFLGLAEVIRHLPFIRRVFRHLRQWIKSHRPVAVILVDYPGFNLKLARLAKKMGIPVVYYICPQLWAWGERRVEKIRRYVDLPLVIFRFEEAFYRKHGIVAHFVGHPLVDQLQQVNGKEAFLKRHSLGKEKPIIALLPGSRMNEVRQLLPLMVQAKQEFCLSHRYQWVVGMSDAVEESVYREIVQGEENLRLIARDTYALMKHAHLAVVASGTATLETGYLGTPMIVLYRVSPLTYFIGKRLVKIDQIALANIVLGKKVVPELIQQDARAECIVEWFWSMLNDSEYYHKVAGELKRIPDILGTPGASRRAAEKIVNFLDLSPQPET